jgi:hypothetical protein
MIWCYVKVGKLSTFLVVRQRARKWGGYIPWCYCSWCLQNYVHRWRDRTWKFITAFAGSEVTTLANSKVTPNRFAKSFCWHLLEWLSGKKHKTSLTKTSLACKIAAHLIQNLNQPRPQHKMELGNQVWQFGVQNRTSVWHIFRPIPTQNNKNEPASLSNAFAHGFTLSLPLDMIVRRISRYEIRMRLKCRHDFVLFVGQPPGCVCVCGLQSRYARWNVPKQYFVG